MVKTGKVRRHGRYPWEDWFKSPKFSLYRGRDYECKPHGMAAMVRNQAYQRGLRVKVLISEEGCIDVQVIKEVKSA